MADKINISFLVSINGWLMIRQPRLHILHVLFRKIVTCKYTYLYDASGTTGYLSGTRHLPDTVDENQLQEIQACKERKKKKPTF